MHKLITDPKNLKYYLKYKLNILKKSLNKLLKRNNKKAILQNDIIRNRGDPPKHFNLEEISLSQNSNKTNNSSYKIVENNKSSRINAFVNKSYNSLQI
ncbi:MAG: hypothetical protein AB1782_00630 [Cyanobacteriota bacterium]